jgi:hypothetical protein
MHPPPPTYRHQWCILQHLCLFPLISAEVSCAILAESRLPFQRIIYYAINRVPYNISIIYYSLLPSTSFSLFVSFIVCAEIASHGGADPFSSDHRQEQRTNTHTKREDISVMTSRKEIKKLVIAPYASWVGFILWPTVSQPVRLGIGLPFGAHDQILSLYSLQRQLLCCSSCKVPSLTRGRVCSLQCNRWLVRSLRTNNHTLLSHLRLCSLFVASYNSQGLRWSYSNPPPHGVPYAIITHNIYET